MKNYYGATIKLQGESNCKRVMDWIEENNFPTLKYTTFKFDIGRMFMVSSTEEPWGILDDEGASYKDFDYYPDEHTKSWYFNHDIHWYFMDMH
jgi:hypothetical protein